MQFHSCLCTGVFENTITKDEVDSSICVKTKQIPTYVMISSDIFDFQQYAFDRRFMKVLCDIINDEKGRIKYFDYASIVLHIQRWTFEIEGHISSHKLILMPILTKTLIAAWENECHFKKESPSLPRGRTLLPWRPKSTWIAGTKSTLAGPNYHLLGEQKIPGFLRRLYALISVHRESLQSQRIQCRPRHL